MTRSQSRTRLAGFAGYIMPAGKGIDLKDARGYALSNTCREAVMETVSDLEKLLFYRDEIKHEFSLLAMRSTILVTCQSFLVVPFAILHAAPNFRSMLVPTYIIAALGIYVALMLRRPLNAAHRTIDKWLIKHRSLMKSSEALKDLVIDRDMIPGVDSDIRKDRDHIMSLAFSRHGPWAFVLFWCALVIWSTLRVVFL
jgi:hypothetical protein